MKQAFQTVLSLLVLAVFLTGTTGVSFFVHECTSSREKEVFPFPEIFDNKVDCCCDGENQHEVIDGNQISSLNAPECCKNTHIYLKASFNGFPQFFQFTPDLSAKNIPTDFLNSLHEDIYSEIKTTEPRVDHPPPRSGKILIHFLQQIKIPAPVS
jgi:hypothetical protein